MSEVSPPRWRVLFAPRWLGWHLFSIVAVAGMILLGKWQFDRAIAGNTLSWAYTFEWPIFAIFGVVFWTKTVRDELHPATEEAAAQDLRLPGGADPAGAEAGPADPAGATDAAQGDAELAEYNAYLAKLASQVKGHGRWHGLR
jgi:hypothetical protein